MAITAVFHGTTLNIYLTFSLTQPSNKWASWLTLPSLKELLTIEYEYQ